MTVHVVNMLFPEKVVLPAINRQTGKPPNLFDLHLKSVRNYQRAQTGPSPSAIDIQINI